MSYLSEAQGSRRHTTRSQTPRASASRARANTLRAALLIGTAAELAGASQSHPFTWLADLLVALALGALIAIVAIQPLPHSTPAIVARRPRGHDSSTEGRRWGRLRLPWVGSLGATAGWELFCYTASPRLAHPTLSSMLDGLDGSPVGRASAFAGWALLGWYLVTR
jgi:nitroreductase